MRRGLITHAFVGLYLYTCPSRVSSPRYVSLSGAAQSVSSFLHTVRDCTPITGVSPDKLPSRPCRCIICWPSNHLCVSFVRDTHMSHADRSIDLQLGQSSVCWWQSGTSHCSCIDEVSTLQIFWEPNSDLWVACGIMSSMPGGHCYSTPLLMLPNSTREWSLCFASVLPR